MKHLVLDTETSGLPRWNDPADAPGQPRIAELGLVYPDDLKIVRRERFYIAPNGWKMDPGATAINGLTDEFLAANGDPIDWALDYYVEAIRGGHIAVAFNSQFDLKMVRGELRRAGMPDLFEETPNLCIMRDAQAHAARVKRRLIKYDTQGRPTSQTGWPKLPDLCRFMGVDLPENAHGALDDAEAAARCFVAMVAEGYPAEPAVHRSSVRPASDLVEKTDTTAPAIPAGSKF